MIQVAGDDHRYTVRFVSWTGIIPCVGERELDAEARLEAALARSGLHTIRSMRRAPEAPDETCWLEGDGWWLSTAPVPGAVPVGHNRITMGGPPWVARRRS